MLWRPGNPKDAWTALASGAVGDRLGQRAWRTGPSMLRQVIACLRKGGSLRYRNSHMITHLISLMTAAASSSLLVVRSVWLL